MGAHPYWYVEPYDPDLRAVLDRLRRREFQAGRYNPVIPWLDFPITPDSPSPGPTHASIEEAMFDSEGEGTRSILDIVGISDEPNFCLAGPLPDDDLMRLYGTTKPARAAVEADMDFLEDVERGHAVYILLYEGDRPTEVMFAGYSLD